MRRRRRMLLLPALAALAAVIALWRERQISSIEADFAHRVPPTPC